MNSELERKIFLNIKRLTTIITADYEGLFDECDATGVQFSVLRNIHSEGSTMTSLKKSVSCAASNMTTLIQRMERDGLVRTDKNPEDLRETRVFVTERGQEVLSSMEPLYRDFLTGIFGSLSDEEQVLLNSLLQKLIAKKE